VITGELHSRASMNHSDSEAETCQAQPVEQI